MADTKETKYLGANGVKWLWQKITQTFVKKDGDKVLSDNNYTNEDKTSVTTMAEKVEAMGEKVDTLANIEELTDEEIDQIIDETNEKE